MAKYQEMMKLFIVMLVCTVFIFSVSYFGPMLLKQNKLANTASEGTLNNAKHSTVKTVATQGKTEEIIEQASVKLGEVPDDLQTFLASNSKIELPAQSSFSLLDLVKKQKLESLSPETLSMVATGIYQVILPTDFTIQERNIGGELPTYAKLGYESRVNPAENEDLVILNPNQSDYVLEIKQAGSNLIVTLKGEKLLYDYKISMKEEQQIKPQTITQYSPMLVSGQTMVKTPGQDGKTVEVFRDAYQGSILVKSELIANDYYPPDYRVIVQAMAVPSTPAATGTATTDGTSQQLSASSNTNTSQSNQNTQTANGTQTTSPANSAAVSSNSSDLYGSPDEPSK